MKKSLFFLANFCFITLSAVLAFAVQLPDTGQTQSYTSTFGEDSDYLINPPSYTKLDEFGNPLPLTATSWYMVRDNNTGLIWEIKTLDGSIHDNGDTYSWQDAQNVFIAQLNADEFGSFDDWRIPNIKELASIVNYGNYDTAINTDYFPNTVSELYWSSTTRASNTGNAWLVYFDNGAVPNDYKTDEHYVRAVRGDSFSLLIDSPSSFVDNGDGTVTDNATGLIWQQTTAGPMNWESAINYSENLSLAGHNDWRLPNIRELHTIVDYNQYQPPIDTDYFPDTVSWDPYWSATTNASDTGKAFCINFVDGGGTYNNKLGGPGLSEWYVRAVRMPLTVPLSIDIIPRTCPNECPIKGGGSIEVAIHGTSDLDVTDIDIASVLLEGVTPVRNSFKDKSSPVISPSDVCDCTTEGRDGFIDLCLKFDKKEIFSELGGVNIGDSFVLTLTGELNDGTPIAGQDCIDIVKKGKKENVD
jgi:hypothetical protein